MKMVTDKEQMETPLTHDHLLPAAAYRLLLLAGGGAAALIGCIALAGWLLNLPRLASLGEGLIPMAPSTAILFVAYGIVFMVARRAISNSRVRLFCRFVFVVGALISVVLFFLSINNIFLGIEHLGIHAMGAVDGTPIGHMSPITAVSFLIISLLSQAVITTSSYRAWWAKTAWWLAILLLVTYFMLILAYFFGTPMFYSGTFIPPAATTSLAFLALGTALMALAQPLAWPEADSHDLGELFYSNSLIVVFLFLVAGIISAGYFYHRKHEKQYLYEMERQLSAITDLKKGQLLNWREERLADASLFFHNIAFENLVKSIIKHPEDKQAHLEIKAWLNRLQSKRNYNRIFLLDAQGNSRLSLPERSGEAVSPYMRQRALESLRTRQVSFVDFYRNEFSGIIYLSILVPLFDPAHEGDALGVLEIRIDPEKYLYPFIQKWPVSSATAETLLVRREGKAALFLNELRFRNNAALNLSVPLERTEALAVMAVMGREGVVKGIDYRGHQVLAALQSIPESPWYLVTRIDDDEVYAPMRERLWITILLVCAMLVSAGTGVGFVWRQQSSRFYRDRYEAELERVELEERLSKIAANLPGAIFQYKLYPDGASCFPYVSSGLVVLYGVRPEEVVQETSPLLAMIHPDDVAEVTATILESARTLSAWHNEHRVIHPDRGIIWVEGSAMPELKPDGSVLLHGFLTEITGRKQKEREIEEKNSELERFTYTVSHDLKSPLVTVSAFLDYLEVDLLAGDKERIAKDIGYMRGASKKIGIMLSELLEMARVGRLDDLPERIELAGLIQEALKMVAGGISERGVRVTVAESTLLLFAKRHRLLEVWQNLLENAVKYMGDQPKPQIEIGIEDAGGEKVFFVRDNGMGIDPRYQKNIFGLFNKLDAASEGSGLGLAMVKRIVEMYEGRVWVDSAGVGTGSCFKFTLPGAMKG